MRFHRTSVKFCKHCLEDCDHPDAVVFLVKKILWYGHYEEEGTQIPYVEAIAERNGKCYRILVVFFENPVWALRVSYYNWRPEFE